MDGTPDAIIKACMAHLAHGTTSICPTTLTCTDEELLTFFDCYREARKQMENGPELLGIHMEGPISPWSKEGHRTPNI